MNRIRIGIFLFALAPLATTAEAVGPGIAFTSPSAVAVQPDGRIVVAGQLSYTDYRFAVARYDAGGGFDSSFGGDGSVTTAIPAIVSDASANAVAVGADGKIVAAGAVFNGITNDVAVAVYNSDGSPDTGFGTGGAVETDLGLVQYEQATGVAVQSDGKIVVVGRAGSNLLVMRYTTAGVLDTTFDSDGVLPLTAPVTEYGIPRVRLQPDGRILVSSAAVGTDNVTIRRYDSDGQLDPTFSDDGITAISGQAENHWMELQADGKIVVATDDGIIVRFTSGGVLDTDFDTDGVLYPPVLEQVSGLVLQGDGKIVAVGTVAGDWPRPMAIVRYLGNGSVDAGFGDAGIARIPPGPDYEYTNAVAGQPDGKLLVAGAGYGYWTGTPWAGYLKRIDVDGTLDSGFAADGVLRETLCDHVPPSSQGCIDASVSSVRICRVQRYWDVRSNTSWKWRGASPATGPAASGAESAYEFCVYDTHGSGPEYVTRRVTSSSGWRASNNGWAYSEKYYSAKAGAKVQTPASPRLPVAQFKSNLLAPLQFSDTKYFEATSGVTLQLVNSDGLCMKSAFTTDEIVQNDGVCFEARRK